jgi:hypothetical protein
MEELIVNGITYVPKEVKTTGISMIRGDQSGVFYGEIIDYKGQTYTIKNARRVWYWAGAASLSQLATDGTSKPSECKFPCAVLQVTLLDVIEVIPMTSKAVESLNGVKEWKA